MNFFSLLNCFNKEGIHFSWKEKSTSLITFIIVSLVSKPTGAYWSRLWFQNGTPFQHIKSNEIICCLLIERRVVWWKPEKILTIWINVQRWQKIFFLGIKSEMTGVHHEDTTFWIKCGGIKGSCQTRLTLQLSSCDSNLTQTVCGCFVGSAWGDQLLNSYYL